MVALAKETADDRSVLPKLSITKPAKEGTHQICILKACPRLQEYHGSSKTAYRGLHCSMHLPKG